MRAASALLLSALLAACGAAPEPAAETALPAEVPPLRDFDGIGGDFALTDLRGAPFALQSLRGRAAMLFFG